jgi:hypothetical protein
MAPAGAGVGCNVQWEPFQRSASARVLPVRLVTLPTAVHAVTEGHETPNSRPARAPGKRAVRSIDQAEPSQRSARAAPAPPRDVAYPTAVQAIRDGHVTAASTAELVRAGVAVRRIDQAGAAAGAASAMDMVATAHAATTNPTLRMPRATPFDGTP